MNAPRRYNLVLAIYPNTRGFAFVAFQGSPAPVDWGVKEIRGRNKNKRCLRSITAMLNQSEPDALVLQDTSPTGTQRARRVRNLNEAIGEFAESRGMPIYCYSREQVRLTFAHVGVPTKHTIAESIAKHIPAFERYLPPARKPWMSEDAKMGLFDAAALALTFFTAVSDGAKGGAGSGGSPTGGAL